MSDNKSSIDVHIAGSGPSGLVLAIELARRKVSFKIIDKNPLPSNRSKCQEALAERFKASDNMKERVIVDWDIFRSSTNTELTASVPTW